MGELSVGDLGKVKDWAIEQLAELDRQKKQLAMANLMMGAMNQASQRAIQRIVSRPNKEIRDSLKGLEKSNREWPAKYQEAINKMESALLEERRKTAQLREWFEALG